MDPNSINQVIDKVAEKAGVAATELQPLGEKVVQEYAAQQWVYAIAPGLLVGFLVVLFVVCVSGLRLSSQTEKKLDEKPSPDDGGAWAAGIFVACVGLCICISLAIYFIGNAVAPTYECLRILLQG